MSRFNIIKIDGKKFNDLSLGEVGLMIDADSSFCEDGNEFFASCALDEFLYGANLKRADLIEIRERILNNIYIDISGSSQKKINANYLRWLSAELKKDGY